jgi:hypothetical protein
MDAGSREENASKQEIEPRSDFIGTEKGSCASVRRLGAVNGAARLMAVVPLHHLH